MRFSNPVGVLLRDRLSPELALMVEDYLSDADLLVLRQVNQEIHDNLQEKWLDTFFTNRTHVFSCHGLRTLVDITAQPILARKLKEVKLCVLEIAFPTTKDSANVTLFDQEQVEASRIRSTWRAQRRRLTSSDTETRLLREVFANLLKLNLVLPVRLTDDWRDSNDAKTIQRKALGREKIGEIGGPFDVAYFKSGACNAVAGTILSAMVLPEYPVERLDLNCPSDSAGLTRRSFELGKPVLRRCRSALVNLTHLDIRLDPKVFRADNRAFGNVARCFQDSPGLRHLTLTVAFDNGRQNILGHLPRMLSCLPIQRIRTLALYGAYSEPGGYIAMLDRARPALKQLHLGGCDVVGSGCWSEVFLWAREHVALEGLRLSSIGHSELGVYEYGDSNVMGWEWEGVADVSQGLLMLSDRPHYQPITEQ